MTDVRQKSPFKRNYYMKAFMFGLALSFLVFIPFIIKDGGRFLFYGDFNVQQVPFYTLAHEAVTSGSIGWNHLTDLGVNFIGSYTFYLLGSPFFWLTIPFPNEFLQFLMGPLLMLKFACASLAAYTYLQRYVKNKDIAILGGILYAFSGFSIYNVFFNHFHESMIIFPLLLAAIDQYFVTKRRGVFAICVALSCLFNYYFFVGQVIFCFIYFMIKVVMGFAKIDLRDFALLALEAVIGLAMSAVLLLPAVLSTLQNDRVDNIISGWSALLYNDNQRYVHIIQSMFFPPDLPARPNFTPDSNAKWASLGAWLPLFGMTGVIAWLQQRRKHWLKRVLGILFACALIPILNSSFQLFNSAYYARWYYMLTLMFALATVMSLESKRVDFKRAIKFSSYVVVIVVAAIGFMTYTETNDGVTETHMGLMDYPTRFWAYAAISLISLACLVYIFRFADKEKIVKNSIIFTSVTAVIYSMFFLAIGKTQSTDPYTHIIPYALNAGEDINLEEIDNSRSDFYESMDNSAMFWQVPTIQTFHSIVPGSVMDFYDYIGVQRGVASRPETSHYALRGIVSVKWLFDDDDDSNYFGTQTYDQPEIEGFTYYGNANGFDIWENDYYIPMGFSYDSYILKSETDKYSQSNRESVMLAALIINDEDEALVSNYLTKYEGDNSLNVEDYFENATERAKSACSFFEYTNTGFNALYNSSKEDIVFFSVPYEDGWTAYVNGKETEIIKSNIGFMSVVVPSGNDIRIEFRYETPGLALGILITISASILLVVYIFIAKKLKIDVKKEKIIAKRKLGSFKEYCKKMNIIIPEKG